MEVAPLPANESQRLRSLGEYSVMDTPPEPDFDELVALAAYVCRTPIALMTLVDDRRQWFKAKKGLEVSETPRDHAFCAHAILNPTEVMVIPDALRDERFGDNPLVTDAPHIRSYVGAPLVSPDGEALGTLCAIDVEANDWTPEEIGHLRALARRVMAELELRRAGATSLRTDLRAAKERIEKLEAQVVLLEEAQREMCDLSSFRAGVIERAAEGVCVCHNIPESPFVRFTVWNRKMVEITGYSMEEINDRGWYQSLYPDPEVRERARKRMERMREGDDLRNERWEITLANGDRRALRISTSVLTTKDGTVHVLALMNDTTEEEEYHRLLETRIAWLERLLPICASCKKIRDEQGHWHEPELYVSRHLHASFTHGICAECRHKLYPDFSD